MRTKTTSCVPVSIPFRSPGSLTYTLEAMGGNCLSQYVFSVTASATAGGKYAGGDWSQTTTNIDSIHYFNGFATDSGFGTTTSNYTYNQPYSGGTSAQPINGNQHQTTDDQVSYNYQRPDRGGHAGIVRQHHLFLLGWRPVPLSLWGRGRGWGQWHNLERKRKRWQHDFL